MGIGASMRQIRLSKGYSQEFVSSKIGISQSHLSRFEANGENISIAELKKLSKVLDVDLDVHCSDKQGQIVFNLSGNTHANGVFIQNEISSEERIIDGLNQIKLEVIKLKNVVTKSIKTTKKNRS